MSSYLDGIKGAVGSAVCFVADKLDAAATYTFGTPPGSIRGPACNDPTPPPQQQPPFSGGQCSGASYQVSMAWDVYSDGATCDTPTQATATRNATGPIRGVSLSSFNGIDGPCPEGEGDTVTLNASNVDGSPRDIIVQGVGSDIFANVAITNITPIGAAPNNCGDPPISPPVPPPPQPISFTYTNNEGDEITVEGDVNIGIPILIAPFAIVAPVTITAGGIEFNGSVNLSPDFDVTIAPSFGGSGDGPGGGGGGDGEPTEPIPPDEEDPSGTDDPIACEDSPLKGLVVTLQFSENMTATELTQDTGIPSIGVPRVAIVYFIARVGNREVYMAGVDLKSRQQYVPVPYNSIVTCWRIHTEPGVSVRSVRPVFDIPSA